MSEIDTLNTLAAGFDVAELVQKKAWIDALTRLIPALYPTSQVDPETHARAEMLRTLLLAQVRSSMLESRTAPRNRMKFGTSGWRGLLVDDFTLHNVACVTQGLVDTLLDPAHHAALGVKDNQELRARGCVIAHDTRLGGPEFAEMAARVILAHGIPVADLNMATTPEVSTAIHELHAAFSINFTPSHNPFTYQGYKFNPADGGPAPESLTGPVALRANQIIDQKLGFKALDDAQWDAARQDPTRYRIADPIVLYMASLEKRLPWLKLPELIDHINRSGMEIFVDNGFGATRGKYERLLAGIRPGALHVYNGGEDYLFGGKNREPSVENFQHLQAEMAKSKARLVVGFMNDGDGDRFVGGGRESVLVMNKFGPLVVRFLTREKGLTGDVTRSVMTSHMADAARAVYLPDGVLHETPVGFQYFRSTIPISVNSWEESDGMSPKGWNLDKDGMVAALILTAMVLHYDEPAEALLARAEQELGHFYFERRKVSGAKSGDALKGALSGRFGTLRSGDPIDVAGRTFHIDRLITLDGFKVVLDNGWWFGVRASGTEPVVRPYVETFTGRGANQAEQLEALHWQQTILAWLVKEIEAVVG